MLCWHLLYHTNQSYIYIYMCVCVCVCVCVSPLPHEPPSSQEVDLFREKYSPQTEFGPLQKVSAVMLSHFSRISLSAYEL